jgi:hypothetical protein
MKFQDRPSVAIKKYRLRKRIRKQERRRVGRDGKRMK